MDLAQRIHSHGWREHAATCMLIVVLYWLTVATEFDRQAACLQTAMQPLHAVMCVQLAHMCVSQDKQLKAEDWLSVVAGFWKPRVIQSEVTEQYT